MPATFQEENWGVEMLEAYMSMLDLVYYEVQFAFEGMAAEHVWLRPAEGLLSVGELAGHIAYWEAVRLAGESDEDPPDLTQCAVQSPLIDHRFRYYPNILTNLDEPPLAMTADQVYKELMRVHEESLAHVKSRSPDLSSRIPGSPHFTYGEYLKYLVFHVAYHTGQMYSARHLLGETPPDN